jgi:hypothetical protein
MDDVQFVERGFFASIDVAHKVYTCRCMYGVKRHGKRRFDRSELNIMRGYDVCSAGTVPKNVLTPKVQAT